MCVRRVREDFACYMWQGYTTAQGPEFACNGGEKQRYVVFYKDQSLFLYMWQGYTTAQRPEKEKRQAQSRLGGFSQCMRHARARLEKATVQFAGLLWVEGYKRQNGPELDA